MTTENHSEPVPTRPRRRSEEPGLVLINTGTGKGKTTAAMGVALRALGHGMKVAMVQFVKGHWRPGEVKAASALPGFELMPLGVGFTWTKTEADHLAALKAAWARTQEVVRAGRHDLVILDEVNYVLGSGKLPTADVFTTEDLIALLRERPTRMHVILTGRYAPEELIAFADTVTEMRPVKHAFQAGRKATKGIEF
jgi:cob(I)alamin adenosyltransferase